MVLMGAYCKLTSLACCLKDGETLRLARLNNSEPDLKSREIKFAVEELPSVLDFTSYMYFCGSAMSGPWFEFKDLMQLFRVEGHYKEIHSIPTFVPGFIRFI